MQTALNRSRYSINRTARAADLFQIDFCTVSTQGLNKLSPLARSWFAFYLSLVRLGYTSIKAPLEAICKAQFLAFGYTRSRRSAQRANAELETLGFIHRPNLRLKNNSKQSVIILKTDRFSFWTKKKCDKNLHAPILPTDKLTSNPKKLQTYNPDVLSLNSLKSKNNAKKTPTGQNKTACDRWIDPRLYTIGLVLDAEHRPQKSLLKKRAAAACRSDRWPKWSAATWQTLTHAEREHIARAELIPDLEFIATETSPNPLTALIAQILDPRQPEPEPLTEPEPEPLTEPEPAPITLSAAEFAILAQAKKRAKNNY